MLFDRLYKYIVVVLAFLFAALPASSHSQTVKSFNLSPTTITGGLSVSASVIISSAAKTGGLSVTLSSNQSFATPPATVTVPAGSQAVEFKIPTSLVSAQGIATLKASANSTSATNQLTVTPITLTGMSLYPSTIVSGTKERVTVNISTNAPEGGVVVNFSGNQSAAMPTPSTITVPAGRSSWTVTLPTYGVLANVVDNLTATLNGSTETANLTITPTYIDSSTVYPNPVLGGKQAKVVIHLFTDAAAGGVSVPISSDSSVATVPATCVVPAGNQSGSFFVTTSSVSIDTTVHISATYGGHTRTVNLIVATPAATGLSVPPGYVYGGESATGEVTLSEVAPAGGTVVNLYSNTSIAQVKNAITVPAGKSSATFTITTSQVAQSTEATISAVAGDVTQTAPLEILSQNATAWLKFHHDNYNTGISNGYGAAGAIQWSYLTTASKSVESSAAIPLDGSSIIGSDDDYIYCVNANGTLRWKVKTGAPVYSSAAVWNNKVAVIGSEDDNVYGLNPQTGAILWKVPTGGPVYSSPVVTNSGIAFIGSRDGNLYAIDVENGEQLWTYNTGTGIDSSPALSVGQQIVYFGCNDSNFYGVYTQTGALIWQQPVATDGVLLASPVVDSADNVYIGSENGTLYSFNATNGSTNWSVNLASSIVSSPVVASNGDVIVGAEDGYLYDVKNGTVEWSFKTNGVIKSSPCFDYVGNIYIGSDDQYLYCLDPSGSLSWKVLLGGAVQSPPAIGADGHVVVGASDGKIYRIQ